jgi:hypothetical protein
LMTRVDLSSVTEEPPSPIGWMSLPESICGIASFMGQPPWELHTAGDELLHILSGRCDLTVRDETSEATRTLRAGPTAEPWPSPSVDSNKFGVGPRRAAIGMPVRG